MCKENLLPRAQSLSLRFSGISPETVAHVERLASDAFAEYGAPYQIRPIADILPAPLKREFLKALSQQIEAPGNKDSFKAKNLRTYVAVGLSAKI